MQSHEDDFTKRALKRDIRQTDEIEKADTDFLRNCFRTTYGINRRSNLVEFPAFDIVQQTPLDIVHAILEGTAPLEIKNVLHHLVQSGRIDLGLYSQIILRLKVAPNRQI